MKIWIDGAPIVSRPIFKFFDGDVKIAILAGFTFYMKKTLHVEPRYAPILIIAKRKTSLRIEFRTFKARGLRFIFTKKRPFLYIERLTYED